MLFLIKIENMLHLYNFIGGPDIKDFWLCNWTLAWNICEALRCCIGT